MKPRSHQTSHQRSSESLRCAAPGCQRTTREGKPFCPPHVALHPYVQGLLAQLHAQAGELERVARQGARAVDPEGMTCQEVLQFLNAHGGRSVAKLARDLNLEVKVLGVYVQVLARQRKVKLSSTQRGSQVVELHSPRQVKKKAKKKRARKKPSRRNTKAASPVAPPTERDVGAA